ncbi:MAG TPA: succinate dehydrogenase iron-sulfur subunit [Frankiaceae bacterium]|nr:succinate dehydrogenase iron-sulfur subunit [Frankiaceae bacterium]
MPEPVILKIRRFDPERDSEPHWERYEVPVEPGDRLLDALHWVKWNLDGSLAFRRSCDQGSCGDDVMRINGENRLACTALVRDLVEDHGAEITIEPIKGLTASKDLIVDMEPFFAAFRAVEPWLVGAGRETAGERPQSPEQARRFADTAKCNLCAACTSACPVYWNDAEYVGPATIVAAHRFIFDSRDAIGEQRLEVLNDREGVWRCRTTFNCTEACPRGIQVTQAVQEVKRSLLARRI